MRNHLCRIPQLSPAHAGAARITSRFAQLLDKFSLVQRNRKFASATEATNRRFSGKVAVVTGGASGLGEATVRRFVKEGAQVVIADVQEGLGKKLAEELGPATQFKHTDVTKEEQVAAAVDAAVAFGGHLDIMVNNAGIIGAIGAIDELDMEEHDYTMAVNLRGMVLGVKHAARVMKPAQKGSIVCTGSTASEQAGLGPHCYTIAKNGIKGLVRSAAFELRSHGVRVNMVSPDGVPTPMVATAFSTFPSLPKDLTVDGVKKILEPRTLLKGQCLTPDAVAAAIEFLASDDSAYMTGHNLLLDGGRTTAQQSMGMDEWFIGRIPFLREAGIRSVAP